MPPPGGQEENRIHLRTGALSAFKVIFYVFPSDNN